MFTLLSGVYTALWSKTEPHEENILSHQNMEQEFLKSVFKFEDLNFFLGGWGVGCHLDPTGFANKSCIP